MVENSRDTVLVLLKAEEDELSLNASSVLVDGNQLIRDIFSAGFMTVKYVYY